MYGALTSYSLVGLDLCFFVLIFLSGPSLLNHFYFGLSHLILKQRLIKNLLVKILNLSIYMCSGNGRELKCIFVTKL